MTSPHPQKPVTPAKKQDPQPSKTAAPLEKDRKGQVNQNPRDRTGQANRTK